MKGNAALCLLLFLLMVLLPLLAMGGNRPQEKAPAQSGASSLSVSQAEGVSAKDEFKILDTSTNKVVTVSGRDFLFGAIPAEMSPANNSEALKAQGVAAYTYYSRLRAQQKKSPDSSLKGADFQADLKAGEKYVTPELQKSRWGENYQTYSDKLNQLVSEIYGQALEYQGELACTTFYAISSGCTESSAELWGGQYSYLVPVASPGDAYAAGYQTAVTLTEDQVRQAVLKKLPDTDLSGDPSGWFGDIERTQSGSVKNIAIAGKTLSGADARTLFGLRSQNFTVNFSGNFTFSVRGYGHGVGMSQVGAQYMAAQGTGYKTILSWYYPGTKLEQAAAFYG